MGRDLPRMITRKKGLHAVQHSHKDDAVNTWCPLADLLETANSASTDEGVLKNLGNFGDWLKGSQITSEGSSSSSGVVMKKPGGLHQKNVGTPAVASPMKSSPWHARDTSLAAW